VEASKSQSEAQSMPVADVTRIKPAQLVGVSRTRPPGLSEATALCAHSWARGRSVNDVKPAS
jgi:hypothetical protein